MDRPKGSVFASDEDGRERSPEFRRGKCGLWKRTPPPKILDGEAEAGVIALYKWRQGYANGSLRLLAGKVAESGIADKPRNSEADANPDTSPERTGRSQYMYSAHYTIREGEPHDDRCANLEFQAQGSRRFQGGGSVPKAAYCCCAKPTGRWARRLEETTGVRSASSTRCGS